MKKLIIFLAIVAALAGFAYGGYEYAGIAE